jgi:hypothetical protein
MNTTNNAKKVWEARTSYWEKEYKEKNWSVLGSAVSWFKRLLFYARDKLQGFI